MPLFHFSASRTFPKELHLCTKNHLWRITSPRLTTQDAPLVIREWVLCPCGGVLLKVAQPPRVRTHTVPEHRWFWSQARHSSVPSGKVAVTTGLLRMSDSGGSEFFVFSCCCCSGHFCFRLRRHIGIGATVPKTQFTGARTQTLVPRADSVLMTRLEGSLYLICAGGFTSAWHS